MNADNISRKKYPKLNKLGEYVLQFIAVTLILLGLCWIIQTYLNEPKEFNHPTAAKTSLKDTIQTHHADTGSPASADKETAQQNYWAVNGTRGDFTGGIGGTIFAAAGFVYLYLSFAKQRESNKTQLETFAHEKIESRFFELISLHRDNVNELSFTYYPKPAITSTSLPSEKMEKETVTHRKIFQVFKKQFEEIEKETGFFFAEAATTDIYEYDYQLKVSTNPTIIQRKIKLDIFAKADVLYLLVFFGLGKDGQETILSITKDKYKRDFIERIMRYAALKPKVESSFWIKWATISDFKDPRAHLETIATLPRDKKPKNMRQFKLKGNRKDEYFYPWYSDDYEKYYGGHQFRLGHYFRHLYQTVSFINNLPDLPGNKQRGYIRHLRGQLSTDEQIIFFLNSLSQLGRVWELEDKKTAKAIDRASQMISDYGLIKNIPNNTVVGNFQLSYFYPDINYEGFVVVKPT